MMVQILIDNVPIDVSEGSTVLEAARKMGLDIPAMCFVADHEPNTSCMCCLVRVDNATGVVPSCATKVRDGMQIESESREIRALRKTGIELLLGDHAGDCHAPCQTTCPAKMDIPNMLRLVAQGNYAAALATVKRDIALPAILGRVCPEVCEQACRRGQHDSPAAICKIKRFVADRDLLSAEPYRPEVMPDSGKQIAVVGAGPTGITAIYHLRQYGHRCSLFEAADRPGGRLRHDFRDELPANILQSEADAVLALGVDCHWNRRVTELEVVSTLVDEFDAVLLATGREVADWRIVGIETTKSGLRIDGPTRMTSTPGLFAAGNIVRPYKLVVQSVAEGKLAAECIDGWLRGHSPPDRRVAYETRLARLTNQELCDFCEGAVPTPRVDSRLLEKDVSDDVVQLQASRCLECDCRALANCLLHHYASMYDCDAHHFRGDGRHFAGRLVGEQVTLEHGKCILCGICVQLANETADATGLAVMHRGIATRIAPAPGETIDTALGSSARRCAEACPTGAIFFRDQ